MRLLDDLEEVIATAITNNDGVYSFDNSADLQNAAWIEVESTLPHGGMSAIDALAIQRRLAGLSVAYWSPENGFLNHVADVGGDGLRTTDAAQVQLRSIFPNTEFTPEDGHSIRLVMK